MMLFKTWDHVTALFSLTSAPFPDTLMAGTSGSSSSVIRRRGLEPPSLSCSCVRTMQSFSVLQPLAGSGEIKFLQWLNGVQKSLLFCFPFFFPFLYHMSLQSIRGIAVNPVILSVESCCSLGWISCYVVFPNLVLLSWVCSLLICSLHCLKLANVTLVRPSQKR